MAQTIHDSGSPASTLAGQQAYHFIQFAELTIDGTPDADYLYRCTVVIDTELRPKALTTQLEARSIPYWMINLKHRGECQVTTEVEVRSLSQEGPWRSVGQVVFNTQESLRGSNAVNIVVPVESWPEAPKLKLRYRVIHYRSDKVHYTHQLPRLPVRGPSQEELRATPRTTLQNPPAIEPIELSPQEEVIVKDTWNKLLAFKELCVELFYKRLLADKPELAEMFGGAVDHMDEQFFGLFDLCVRQLQPHTESILREAYRGVHPSPERSCNSIEEYGELFASLGMTASHWEQAREIWMWHLAEIPYIEEYESENLAQGEASSHFKFFTSNIMAPMLDAIRRRAEEVPVGEVLKLRAAWDVLCRKPETMAGEVWQGFSRCPEALAMMPGLTPEDLATGLFGSFEGLSRTLTNWHALVPDGMPAEMLKRLPATPAPMFAEPLAALLSKYVPEFDEQSSEIWGRFCERIETNGRNTSGPAEKVRTKAHEYLEQVAEELGWAPHQLQQRLQQVDDEISRFGTYTHTYEEMAFGARLAWRNASKCVGRMSWKSLIIRDCRHVTHPDEMFDECVEHLKVANNEGRVQPLLTMFRPRAAGERWGPRVWNPQLVRYAAYKQTDGSILGDQANAGLTEAILDLGWTPPNPKTAYDVLPLVIEVPGKQPSLYQLPKEHVLEVQIRHPSRPGIEEMGLRWYAIPAISNFRLDIGGISYSCCPFNGWYLCTEIARDFLDHGRYDLVEKVAEALGLDTSSETTMWRDEVFLEINKAVVYSFQKDKVTIVDQHNASRQFLTHDLREKKAGRECPGQWSWVVPPLGGSVCPVYHHEMRDFFLEPQYYYAADRWAVEKNHRETGFEESELLSDEMEHDRNADLLVLYASDLGTGESLAFRVARRLEYFRVRTMPLDAYRPEDPAMPKVLLIVAATGHSGDIAAGGKKFVSWLAERPAASMKEWQYSVLALGNSHYEHFCAAGKSVDRALHAAGAQAVVPLQTADTASELGADFETWLDLVARSLGEDPSSAHTDLGQPSMRLSISRLSAEDSAEITKPRQRSATIAMPPANGRGEGYRALSLAGTGLSYQTGDHAAIYALSSADLVAAMSRHLGMALDVTLMFSYVGRYGENTGQVPPISSPCTVQELLSSELDLQLREPLRALLERCLLRAKSDDERNRLEAWLTEMAISRQQRQQTVAVIQQAHPTIVDLLAALPSVRLTVVDLVECLARPRPEIFAIASSPAQHPEEIHLVGKMSELAVSPGEPVRVCVLETRFRPPQNPQDPMLMIASGSGVQGFLGFLQHRQAQHQVGQSLGASCLFVDGFGGAVMEDELEVWLKRGVLSYLRLLDAESVDMSPEMSSLHASLVAQGEELWQLLNHPRGHCYISADRPTIDEARRVLLHLATEHGKLSEIAARQHFRKMAEEGRFSVDLWQPAAS